MFTEIGTEENILSSMDDQIDIFIPHSLYGLRSNEFRVEFKLSETRFGLHLHTHYTALIM